MHTHIQYFLALFHSETNWNQCRHWTAWDKIICQIFHYSTDFRCYTLTSTKFLYCLGGIHLKYISLSSNNIIIDLKSTKFVRLEAPNERNRFMQNKNETNVLRIIWSNRSEIWTKRVSPWVFCSDKLTSRFNIRFGKKFWN